MQINLCIDTKCTTKKHNSKIDYGERGREMNKLERRQVKTNIV